MLLIQSEIEPVEVIHRKGDDFSISFELTKEDDSPFDLNTVSLRWDIFEGSQLVVSISGGDLLIDQNQVTFHKSFAAFMNMSPLTTYTHQMYDTDTNTTLFEGPFKVNPAPSFRVPGILYFGWADSSVVDSDDVIALPQSEPSSVSEFTLATGTVRTKFIIAIPADKAIVSVTDESALGVEISAQYESMGTISVESGSGLISYKIFEMNIAVPYSTSHNHLIKIQ